MTTEAQKELEIHFATKVSERLGKSWKIISSPNERDWPDVLVTENDHKFGLEIREIYPDESRKGSQKRSGESYNFQGIDGIARKYYENSEISIKVNFIGSFDNEELILSALTSASSNLADFEQVRLEPFQGCVLYVTKLPSSLGKYDRWIYVSDRVGWVGELNDDLIQEKVNEKSANLIKYTKHINDVRLLLVCNRKFNSGKFVYSPKRPIVLGGFKEVYFLSYPDSVCELSST